LYHQHSCWNLLVAKVLVGRGLGPILANEMATIVLSLLIWILGNKGLVPTIVA
jgi:hypothetical protein